MKLERILCPLDLSQFSSRAFEYALSLARRYKSKLLIEHVLHLPFSAYPSYVNTEHSIGPPMDSRGVCPG